jgi:hypothetical protein
MTRAMINVYACGDCEAFLLTRSSGMTGGTNTNIEWFMLKGRVWAATQRKGACRFLCVGCVETRIGRKPTSADFMRTAKVNFEPVKSARLRRRKLGLKPAKRLVNTTFTPEPRRGPARSQAVIDKQLAAPSGAAFSVRVA